MDNLQIIKSPKGEEMVVLSRKAYDRLTRAAPESDARLATAQMQKIKKGETTFIPEAVARTIAVDGLHPIRAWRDHRGWTAEQLAKKAHLARATIAQIETGKRKGTVAAYKAIAKALGIGIGSLID
jgi:DNA-binding XRE family transcriptional regulator